MSTTPFPPWLHALAIVSLTLAGVCAVIIVVDEVRRPQKMWIMNLVWPVTALFGSVIWLTGYFVWGRGAARHATHTRDHEKPPFSVMVAKGASHCGAGCTLGDLVAEWLIFFVPSIAVGFGWKSVFHDKMYAIFVADFVVAFTIGIAFQYFTIKPMRHLSTKEGVIQAVKADFASIAAWQVGMYGFMAFAQLVWFEHRYGGRAEVDTPEFWFTMQLAMLCGFVTNYPINWLLLKWGVKERM